MSKENGAVEEKTKKKLPIKEACYVLVGIIIGIVVSYGVFACAIKEVADTKAEQVTSANEDSTPNESNEEATSEEKETEVEGTTSEEKETEVEGTTSEEKVEEAE